MKKYLKKNCTFTAAVGKKAMRLLRRELKEEKGMFGRHKDK